MKNREPGKTPEIPGIPKTNQITSSLTQSPELAISFSSIKG
jgi:hypothetical protein